MFKMENTKEGGYVNRPSILDRTNFDRWKACMVAFLKYMDNKTWKVVINGQTPSKVTTEDNFVYVKLEKD